MKDLIIASNNQNKIREYKDILEPLGFKVLSQNEAGINIEVEETGTTFEENSCLKAEAIYNITHKNVIADDSGLEITALNNEPGIYSARYKGIKTPLERNKYVLKALKDVKDRSARFICTICYIDEKGHKELFKGIWNGRIAKSISGNNGFGYDPIFIANEKRCTTANLTEEEKNKISHRGRATKLLLEYLSK